MSIMNPMATGIFFDERNLKKIEQAIEKLNFPRLNEKQNVIFLGVNRNPSLSDIHEEWIGREVLLCVIGYGRNDHLEAFRAQFYPTKDDKFDAFLRKTDPPAIIISKNGQGDISDVSFWGLESPFFVRGKYGVLTTKGEVSVGEQKEDKDNVHGNKV